MKIIEFNSIMENWALLCGPPSTLISIVQIVILALSIWLSFKVTKLGLKKYFTYVLSFSFVPILIGAFFYWMGLQKGERALRSVVESDVESLRIQIHSEAMSCLLGSASYLIWILLILVVTTVFYFAKRTKKNPPIQ
jgi:hypothetical protein